MASQCLGRRTNERLLFGDGKHYFYTEERCKRKTAGGLCSVCDGGAALEHGIISEAIPPLSHIYGSAWYDLKRTVYGNPSSQDMAKAKKAQEVSSPVISPVTSSAETASPTKAVKKRTFKVATTATRQSKASTEKGGPSTASRNTAARDRINRATATRSSLYYHQCAQDRTRWSQILFEFREG
jgi:hypothetical protein